jgi:hypothetical protein
MKNHLVVNHSTQHENVEQMIWHLIAQLFELLYQHNWAFSCSPSSISDTQQVCLNPPGNKEAVPNIASSPAPMLNSE